MSVIVIIISCSDPKICCHLSSHTLIIILITLHTDLLLFEFLLQFLFDSVGRGQGSAPAMELGVVVAGVHTHHRLHHAYNNNIFIFSHHFCDTLLTP